MQSTATGAMNAVQLLLKFRHCIGFFDDCFNCHLSFGHNYALPDQYTSLQKLDSIMHKSEREEKYGERT